MAHSSSTNQRALQDFWRSVGYGAAGLPRDYVLDPTVPIGRVGELAVGGLTPSSTLDSYGSLGMGYQVVTSASFIAGNAVVTDLAAGSPQIVQLSAADRRFRVLRNATPVAKTVVAPGYQSLQGTITTVIPANTSVALQHIAGVWTELWSTTASAAHPAASFTNTASPFTFNAATQVGNIPQSPTLTSVGGVYTFTDGAGGTTNFTVHPAASFTSTAAPFSFNAATQAGNIPVPASLTLTGTSAGVNTYTFVDGAGGAPITLNVPTVMDFWRGVAPAPALPDGTTDNTDSIRRDGLVGLNVNPVSNFDNNGSLGLARQTSALATATAAVNDYMIDLTGTTAQTVTLPAASGAARRIYVIRNATTAAKATSIAYQTLNGTATTVVPQNSVLTLQSDGANWLCTSISSTAAGVVRTPFVGASGRINIGDPVPVGARPIINGFNIASATGIGGSITVSQLQVVFTTPLPAGVLQYLVNGEIVHQVSAGPAAASTINDSSVTFTISAKTNTGFTITFRESLAIAQSLFFDFEVSFSQ
jgi:hypothetical protein